MFINKQGRARNTAETDEGGMSNEADTGTGRKLKTLKTMEEVEAFFKTERVQLSPEDLDKITGGWNFFDPIENALKDAGKWMYDNMIDPVVDAVVDAGKTVVGEAVEVFFGLTER